MSNALRTNARNLDAFVAFLGADLGREATYVGAVIHDAFIYAITPEADGEARADAFDAASAAYGVSVDALYRWAGGP